MNHERKTHVWADAAMAREDTPVRRHDERADGHSLPAYRQRGSRCWVRSSTHSRVSTKGWITTASKPTHSGAQEQNASALKKTRAWSPRHAVANLSRFLWEVGQPILGIYIQPRQPSTTNMNIAPSGE